MAAKAVDQRIKTSQHRSTIWPDQFPTEPTVEWIRTQPELLRTARLSIWDETKSEQPKVLRIRQTGGGSFNGINRSDPYVTVYLPAGTRTDVSLQPGSYDVVAMSGDGWTAETGFGDGATTVSYGSVVLVANQVGTVAMGATDQPMKQVTRDWM